MTIKQTGGIFGRNPTFNDVEIDGSFSTSSLNVDNNGVVYSNGNVGIGITPSAWRSNETVVQLPDAVFYAGNNYASIGQNYYIPEGGGSRYIENNAASDYYQSGGQHVFRVAGSGTAGNSVSWTTAATITSSGNLAFPSGQGIDFSATSGTGTSELFDDYEEGTFTPNLLFGGANTGMTYSAQTGLYTKIGNAVVFSIRIALTAKGSSTGDALISGLPFTAGSTFRGNFSVFHQSVNIDTAGGYYTFCAQPNPSNTTLTLREVGDNISAAAITSSDFSNTSLVDICGTYRA